MILTQMVWGSWKMQTSGHLPLLGANPAKNSSMSSTLRRSLAEVAIFYVDFNQEHVWS